MKQRIRASILAVLVALTLSQVGCGRAGFAALRTVAAVATVATILAMHDSHFHSHHCGHEFVYVDERPVYHYQGRWEYYDDNAGNWYYYDEQPR